MSKGDCFFTIDGVTGESEDSAFPGAIEVAGWNWGMKQPLDEHNGSGHDSAGRFKVRLFEFEHQIDTASAQLQTRLGRNTVIKKAVLTMRRAGGTAQKYLNIELKSARVVSIDIVHDAQHRIPIERVCLAFENAEFIYVPQANTGASRTGEQAASWDLNPKG